MTKFEENDVSILLHRLIIFFKNDKESTNLINDFLISTIAYHRNILDINVYCMLGTTLANDLDDYRNRLIEIDKSKRFSHKVFLSNVCKINHLCNIADLPELVQEDELFLYKDRVIDLINELIIAISSHV